MMLKARTLGIYGGTFDPIHEAHLRLAHCFIETCQLDELQMIPAGQPYHKTNTPLASGQHRLNMVKLAVADCSNIKVNDCEIQRLEPSYTIDTLEYFQKKVASDTIIWILMGSDSLKNIHTWHRYQDILKQANIAVAIRSEGDLTQCHPDILAQVYQKEINDCYNSTICGKIRILPLDSWSISSTEIRESLASGRTIGNKIHPDVYQYILDHHLYIR